MRSYQRMAAVVGLVAVLVLATGCGDAAPSSAEPAAAAAPSPDAAAPTPSQRELAEAVAFRKHFGLRADETWVLAVAANPDAQVGVSEFGVPLLPEEFADLTSRTWDPDLFQHVRGYGLLFPEDFGGARINLEGSGVVIYFAHRVERHRAALSNLTPPGSEVDVRAVEWSLAELIRFKEAVISEHEWFTSLGVTVTAAEDIADNTVHLRYRGPQAAAGPIEAHFGNPSWLRAVWVGPRPWEGPRADLTIKVADPDGDPVAGLRCRVTPVDPSVDPGPDTVWATDSTGICRLEDLPTALFEVTLHAWTASGLDPRPLQTLRVAVRPGGSSITVVVRADK